MSEADGYRKIEKVEYNWINSEKFFEAEVGKPVKRDGKALASTIVKEIAEHVPQGLGDQHYCDVLMADTTFFRVFNVNQVFYSKFIALSVKDKKLIMPGGNA